MLSLKFPLMLNSLIYTVHLKKTPAKWNASETPA